MRAGGFALDRAYTLPPVNFTPREAALLVALGNFAAAMRILPFVDTLGNAKSPDLTSKMLVQALDSGTLVFPGAAADPT